MSKEGAEIIEDSEILEDAGAQFVPVLSPEEAGLPDHRELSEEELEFYRGLLESVLFLSPEPMNIGLLARKMGLDKSNTRRIADSLVDDYAERDGGVQVREIAGGYQFVTSDRYSSRMKDIFREQKKDTLSRSAMETLSIISYRQPITLPEIEEIRGVNSRAHVTALLARNLIKPQGYRPAPGRPTLYVTTKKFLSHFSLNSLTDLPALEELKELRFDELD